MAKENGRRERIRTSGPYVPNVVLYQAELLSDSQTAGRSAGQGLASGGALITMPPCPRNRARNPWAAIFFTGFAALGPAGYTVPAAQPGRGKPCWGVAKR